MEPSLPTSPWQVARWSSTSSSSPSKTKSDSKRPPTHFGAHTATVNASADNLKLTQAQWNVLMQQAQAQLSGRSVSNNGRTGNAKKGNCNKCGEPGHWARECPKNNPRTQGTNSNNNNGPGNGNDKPIATWKTLSPSKTPTCTKAGEFDGLTKWKLERNGRTFHWCAKCGRAGRWSTTHWTGEHTGKPNSNSQHQRRGNNCVSFNVLSSSNDSDSDGDFIPCAFHFNATSSTPSSDVDLLGLLGPYLPFLFLWLSTTLNSVLGPLFWAFLGWSVLTGPTNICDLLFGKLIPWIQRFDPRQRHKARHWHHHRVLRQNNRWKTMRPKDTSSRNWRRRARRPPRNRNPWMTFRRGTRFRSRFSAFDPFAPQPRSNGGGEYDNRRSRQSRQASRQPRRHHQTHNVNTEARRCRRRRRQTDDRTENNNRNTLYCDHHGHCSHTTEECWFNAGSQPFWEVQTPTHETSPATEPTQTNSSQPTIDEDDYLTTELLDHMEEAFAQTNNESEIADNNEQGQMLECLLSAIDYLKASLIDQTALSEHLPTGNQFPVIWDSGASLSLTYDQDDFVGPVRRPTNDQEVGGIGQGINITGIGTVAFTFKDSTGNLRTVLTQGVLCPTSKVKLLSTTALIQQYPGENVNHP